MKLSEKWRQVPRPVKLFLLKGAALFFIWKLLYLGFFLPNRLLDRPLTRLVGVSTSATLNLVNPSGDYSVRSEVDERTVGFDRVVIREEVERIYRSRDRVLAIADVCNGLEVMVLYVGFIIAWGSAARARKIKFLAGGLALILLMNIFRCTALALIYLHKPEYVDFYHHYLFTFLIYGIIFWLWYLFTQNPIIPQKQTLHVTIGE